MAHNEENVSRLLLILSHKIRRDILILLHEKKEQSFSELMNSLEIDTGRMSFHLRNLRLFLEQTPTGKYKLNRIGQNALGLIKDVEALSIDVDFLEKKVAAILPNSIEEQWLSFSIWEWLSQSLLRLH